MTVFDSKSMLVTGGTGSFGKQFVRAALDQTSVRRIIVYSRDELKQYEMRREFEDDPRLRYFLGDVRDRDRLYRALYDVQFVVHAAALKQVPAAEYNPFEAVKTNIYGAQNVIDACIDQGVERVVALSTDKASSPINLYGATKLVSDKLFISGNAYAGGTKTRFSVVRYGNVLGSRGSVLPYFKAIAHEGSIPITDERMTRFWITLSHGVRAVFHAMTRMRGGEIFVPKIPSMCLVDLARAIAPEAQIRIVGIRPGEKLHEEMISAHDARLTVDVGDFYIIQPEFEWWTSQHLDGTPVPEGFVYSSDNNADWLTMERLRELTKDA